MNPYYNSDNNILFTPDSISDLQEVRDDSGNLIRVMSDIEFILHNESHRKYDLPASVLRDYLDRSKDLELTQSFNHHQFTDEQLMNALIPSNINTVTDAYQFSKYLESHHSSIKKAINDYLLTIKSK